MNPPERALLLACAVACAVARSAHAATPTLVRAPAPEFHVRSLDGRDLRLTSLRHHGPVIVEFWGLKCDHCSEALTELESWRKRYGANGLSIVAFSVDGSSNISSVRPYVTRLHVGYPVAIDNQQRIQRLYHASSMPTSFLVDRAGNVAAIRDGFIRGDTAFVSRLETQFQTGSKTAGRPR